MNSKEDFRQQLIFTITSFIKTNNVKYLFLFILLAGSINQGDAQKQLDVQGQINSEDTVMVVRVNSNAMFTDVVGLDVFSHPAPGRGIGGSFYGGRIGLIARSRQKALIGESLNEFGVYATSESGSAGFFRGGDGANDMDIMLGGSNWAGSTNGDEAVIGIHPLKTSGDLWLVSNDGTVIHLDKDNDESGHLFIKNGEDDDVLTIDESGHITFDDGTKQMTAPYKTSYQTVEVGTPTAFTLGVVNLWQPLGDEISFTKIRDDTTIEASMFGFVYGDPNGSNSIKFAIRIDGNAGDLEIVDLKGNANQDICLRSIFNSLASGNHTIQIYASTAGVPAPEVRIDQFTPVLIIETF